LIAKPSLTPTNKSFRRDGFPLSSGFQMELGFASIGIGLVGFLSFWNKAYWLPFIILKFIFG
jgi:hypothetical protein